MQNYANFLGEIPKTSLQVPTEKSFKFFDRNFPTSPEKISVFHKDSPNTPTEISKFRRTNSCNSAEGFLLFPWEKLAKFLGKI